MRYWRFCFTCLEIFVRCKVLQWNTKSKIFVWFIYVILHTFATFWYASPSEFFFLISIVILTAHTNQPNHSHVMPFPWSSFYRHFEGRNLRFFPSPSLSIWAGGGGNQASGSVFLSCRSPQVPTCQYLRQRLGSAVAQLTSSPTATPQGTPVPVPAQRQAQSHPPPLRPTPPLPPILLPNRTHRAPTRKGQHPGSNSKQYGSWREFTDVLDVLDDGHVESSQRVKREKILEKSLKPEGKKSSVTQWQRSRHLIICINIRDRKDQYKKGMNVLTRCWEILEWFRGCT